MQYKHIYRLYFNPYNLFGLGDGHTWDIELKGSPMKITHKYKYEGDSNQQPESLLITLPYVMVQVLFILLY